MVELTAICTEEDIAIVPDKNTSSLIVYANMKNQVWVKKFINMSDKRRPKMIFPAETAGRMSPQGRLWESEP